MVVKCQQILSLRLSESLLKLAFSLVSANMRFVSSSLRVGVCRSGRWKELKQFTCRRDHQGLILRLVRSVGLRILSVMSQVRDDVSHRRLMANGVEHLAACVPSDVLFGRMSVDVFHPFFNGILFYH